VAIAQLFVPANCMFRSCAPEREGDYECWVPVPIQYPAASCRGVSFDVVMYSTSPIELAKEEPGLQSGLDPLTQYQAVMP
jgi:hypothetical protein